MTDIEKIKAALEPFAISIKDHVPDDQVIETVAWTAWQHRAACEALDLLSTQASRVAELEGALEVIEKLRGSIKQATDLFQQRGLLPSEVNWFLVDLNAAINALGPPIVMKNCYFNNNGHGVQINSGAVKFVEHHCPPLPGYEGHPFGEWHAECPICAGDAQKETGG